MNQAQQCGEERGPVVCKQRSLIPVLTAAHALDKLLYVTALQFSHLQNRNNDIYILRRQRLNTSSTGGYHFNYHSPLLRQISFFFKFFSL